MPINSAQLIKWRRQFHTFPEIGWTEFITTATLITELRKLGYDVKTGKTVIHPDFVRGRNADIVKKGLENAKQNGVDETLLDEMDGLTGCVAILDTGKPGPTVALRFDIDCVGIQESNTSTHRPNQDDFASIHPHLMHACGHDGHIAIGLAVATWVMANKTQLKGQIKLLFQPAEEGVRGARPMAESGIVDDVDYFFAMHLGFIANSKQIVINPTNFLCTTKFDFRFYGTSSHAGAQPHLGHNALAGACHAAIQMLGIPRHGEGMSRINVGVIRAGESRNVIPAYGEIHVEVRGENEYINNFMCEEVNRIAKGVALSFNLKLDSEIMGEAVDLTNDQEMVQLLTDVVKHHPELSAITEKVFGGSEDATILAKRVQKQGGKAIYFVVGADLTAGHHQPEFDFDENQLMTAMLLLTDCLKQLLYTNVE